MCCGVGSPPSNEPTTLPFLVVRNARRAAPQSTPQASWRDYNDANYKESPHSYRWSAHGRLNTRLLRALCSIRIARNVVQCIHVAKLSQAGTDLDLDCCTICDSCWPAVRRPDRSLSPRGARPYRCRTSPAKRHPRGAQAQPAVVCTARPIRRSELRRKSTSATHEGYCFFALPNFSSHLPIRISACKSRKTPSRPSTTR